MDSKIVRKKVTYDNMKSQKSSVSLSFSLSFSLLSKKSIFGKNTGGGTFAETKEIKRVYQK